MSTNFQKRQFRTFISHAHANSAIVDDIYHWLHTTAHISTWYDRINFPPSSTLGIQLGNVIPQCQSMIIVLSNDAIRSGWVQEEYNLAVFQRANYRQFTIIPILIEDCPIPAFLQSTKWIDLREGEFTVSAAIELLRSFYYDEEFPDVEKVQDVYISRGWRPNEREADHVCQLLGKAGFRLIGDDEDQPTFDTYRIKNIMSGCGALVAILPNRGGGVTSRHLTAEIEIAKDLNLPFIIVADGMINVDPSLEHAALRVVVDTRADRSAEFPELSQAIELLQEEWRPPRNPFYSFFARDISESSVAQNKYLKDLAQIVTAMPCKVGDEIRHGQIQHTIRERISNAHFIIADISDANVNTCIEAGVALGAKRIVRLIAREPRRRAPFMLSDQQVYFYIDELDLLGKFHMLIRPYRRHILNSEIYPKL